MQKSCQICGRVDHEDELFTAVDGNYYHQTCAEDQIPLHGLITSRQFKEEYQLEEEYKKQEVNSHTHAI